MSNSSQSPEGKPSSEAITTPLDGVEEKKTFSEFSFDDDIPLASTFPVITLVLSLDDPSEPNHVDLGSVPPQIAAAVFRALANQLEKLSWPSRVTYAGQMVFDPASLIPQFDDEDDDDDDGLDPC